MNEMRRLMLLLEEYEQWVEAYFDQKPVVRVPNPDGGLRPPKYLYRVMSIDEWRLAERTGYFRSRGGERIHASSKPDLNYHSGPETVIVRFDYHDADGWQAKWGKELYAVTPQAVPFSRATLMPRQM